MQRGAAPTGHARVRHAALVLLVALVAPIVLAGCFAEEAPSYDGVSLLVAHEAAWPEALALDRGALLAGFLARDGSAEAVGEEWLLAHTEEVPAGGRHVRDGSAEHWILLFATPQGRVLRAHVSAAPLAVDVTWASEGVDPVAQMLWSMNLGGRLVVDSVDAMAAARRDPAVHAHHEQHPEAAVSIAATVAQVDDAGTQDLVYSFYWGPADEATGKPFSLFAQVHHYTGRVVAVGDAAQYDVERLVVLVDETFTMGPVPREVFVEKELPLRVTDGALRLEAQGVGAFTLRLLHGNETEVARVEDVVAVGPVPYARELGVLEPGEWVLHLQVDGRITFHLRIEGFVTVPPQAPLNQTLDSA